jgi:small subunit ribosomal protein S20
MPIIQSAIKHARQSKVRRDRRMPFKTRMKTLIRKTSDLAKAGKTAEATTSMSQAFKAIDMAAKKNLIHWKNAARKKSMLSKMVSKKK